MKLTRWNKEIINNGESVAVCETEFLAAEIVQAVNAYPALLEALTLAEQALRQYSLGDHRAAITARAALQALSERRTK